MGVGKGLRVTILIAVLSVSACKKAEAPAAETAADAAKPQPADGKAESPSTPAVSIPLLAYEYDYSLTAPAQTAATLWKAHQTACQDAGPAECQIIAANSQQSGKMLASASLELRATPRWIKGFRDRLEAGVEKAGGRVVEANVKTEDLSTKIVDSEATVRAKTALRARLEGLIANHPGKLEELLEVEKELARVEGEIDAERSELAAMQTRVQTSKLTLNYSAEGGDGRNPFEPIENALSSAFANFMAMIGVIITIISYLAPFLLLAGAGFWIYRRYTPVKTKKPGVVKSPPAAAPDETRS